MLRSSAWVFVSKLLVAGTNFLTIVMLSRWLGAEERGVCGWYLVVIALTLVFSDLIAGPAAGFLLKNHHSRAVRHASYTWSLLTAFIITAVFYLLGKLTGIEFALLLLLCWLNAANSLHLHLLLAKREFAWFNRLSLFTPVATLIILAIFFNFGFQSRIFYLVSLLISWLLTSLWSLAIIRRQETAIQSQPVFQLIKDGFTIGFKNQASHLLGLLSNRLVYFIMPAASLGVYANALSLAEASLMVPGSLGQVLYAEMLNENNQASGIAKFRKPLLISILFLMLTLVVVSVLPSGLYVFLFGEAFRSVKIYLVGLCTAMVFYSGYLVCSYWQSSQGQFIKNVVANIAGLVVNGVITTILLVSNHFTLHMAVLSLGAGYCAMFVTSLLQILNLGRKRQVGFQPKKDDLQAVD